MLEDEDPTPEIAAVQGSLTADSAAAMLSKLRTDAERPRDDGGRFQAKAAPEDQEADEKEPEKVVDIKTKQPVKADEAEAADDEEYFELAAEKEGEAPRRIKVDEVWSAYEELPKVRAELESAKKAQPVPQDYVAAVNDTVKARSDIMRGLEIVAQMIQPKDPSLDLLNPQSDKYDPDAYYTAKTKADRDRAQLKSLNEQWHGQNKQREREQELLDQASASREANALEAAWPEWKSSEGKRKAYDGLKAFGFSDDEISKVTDHRLVLMARDAMDLRSVKAEQAKAVQVVRQKPKLVKGAARTTTDSKAAARSSAMEALAKTGSMAAAASALKGLV